MDMIQTGAVLGGAAIGGALAYTATKKYNNMGITVAAVAAAIAIGAAGGAVTASFVEKYNPVNLLFA